MVELMIGLTVGAIIVAGGLTLYVATTRSQSEMIAAARLEQELRDVMQLITADVRRAGYGALMPNTATNQDGVSDINDLIFNPFLAAANDITTGARTGEAANSCITYTYNLDEENPPAVGGCNGCGSLPGAFTTTAPFSSTNLPYDTNNVEMFGFRLNGGTIESRTGFNSADTSFDCNAGVWSRAIGTPVQITALSFNLTHTQVEVDDTDVADGDATCADGMPCLCIREVAVSLTGQLSTDAFVSKSIDRTVRIRNDKFLSAFDAANPCRG